jgi:hypothetical protein
MALLLQRIGEPQLCLPQTAAECRMTLFEWLAEVCRELDRGVMRAHDMLDDTRWSDLYEQGLTPAQAAARARRDGFA